MLKQHLTPDCVFHLSHPLGTLVGVQEVIDGFLLPLRRALAHAYRRDELFIGG